MSKLGDYFGDMTAYDWIIFGLTIVVIAGGILLMGMNFLIAILAVVALLGHHLTVALTNGKPRRVTYDSFVGMVVVISLYLNSLL